MPGLLIRVGLHDTLGSLQQSRLYIDAVPQHGPAAPSVLSAIDLTSEPV